MGVKSVQLSTTGLIPNTTGLGKALAQQLPVPIFIETNDLLETVLVTGYLNKSRADFQFVYSNQQMALVYTTDQGPVWLAVVISGTNYSLQGTVDVSTVYRASVGSAALPSYTFVGDLDTGMYHVAANTLGFSVNGAKVAEIAAAGLTVTGLLSATNIVLAKGTGTEAANVVTVSANAGVITTSALTTAGAATYTITLTNTFIATSSVVQVTLMGGTNTTPGVSVSATAAAGSSVIKITNNDAAAAALNGTLILGFSVF